MKMAGREVFKAAVLAMAEACDAALSRAGVSADEIDLLIPHQANLRIIEATAKHAGIPMSKVMVNVDRFGNTSSASIPLALDQAVAEGRVGPGRCCCSWRSAPGSPGGAPSSGGERAHVPRTGGPASRHGQGPGRAVPGRARTFEAVDDALGVRLSRIMWEGPEEELTLTHNAQPAILAHTAAVLAVVARRAGGDRRRRRAQPGRVQRARRRAERQRHRRGPAGAPAGRADAARAGEARPAPWPPCSAWRPPRWRPPAPRRRADGVAVAANLNAPGPDRHLRRPRGGDPRRRGLQGARRQARAAPQGERRVPLAAHGAGRATGCARARGGDRSPTRRSR